MASLTHAIIDNQVSKLVKSRLKYVRPICPRGESNRGLQHMKRARWPLHHAALSCHMTYFAMGHLPYDIYNNNNNNRCAAQLRANNIIQFNGIANTRYYWQSSIETLKSRLKYIRPICPRGESNHGLQHTKRARWPLHHAALSALWANCHIFILQKILGLKFMVFFIWNISLQLTILCGRAV